MWRQLALGHYCGRGKQLRLLGAVASIARLIVRVGRGDAENGRARPCGLPEASARLLGWPWGPWKALQRR